MQILVRQPTIRRTLPRRVLLASALGAGPAFVAPALADEPLTLIIPSTPGGTTDIVARLIAQALARVTGRTVLPDNAGGAGGGIGTQRGARARADGSQIVIGNAGTFLAAPRLNPGLGVDPARDLRAIGLAAEVPVALAASRQSGIDRLDRLVERARAAPGRLSLGVSGIGAVTHLAAATLLGSTGLEVNLVPYRGGGQTMADLAGGTLDLVMELTPGILPAHQAGHAVALGVGGTARVAGLPDVPTFAETRIADPGVAWYGIAAPASVPDATAGVLADALARALDDTALRGRFETLAIGVPAPASRGSAAFEALFAREAERVAALVASGRLQAS